MSMEENSNLSSQETNQDNTTLQVTTSASADENQHAGAENQSTSNESNQYSDVELQAISQGWKPKEQYKGEDWRPAKEFLERGEMIQVIKNQSKTIKEMKGTMESFQDFMEKRVQHERQRTIQELQLQKREAIQSGDVDRVEELEKEIVTHKEQQVEPTNPADAHKQYVREKVKEFQDRNKHWYNSDTDENLAMMEEANRLDLTLMQANPNMDVTDALSRVERMMQKKYPQKFGLPNRNVSSVEGNTPPVNKRTAYDPRNITAEMRKNAEAFQKNGILKPEEYYAQLHKMGVLK